MEFKKNHLGIFAIVEPCHAQHDTGKLHRGTLCVARIILRTPTVK